MFKDGDWIVSKKDVIFHVEIVDGSKCFTNHTQNDDRELLDSNEVILDEMDAIRNEIKN